MYFDSVQEVLVMNGHGVYVWPAYLITILIIMAVFIAPLRRSNRLLTQVASEVRRANGRVMSGSEGEP